MTDPREADAPPPPDDTSPAEDGVWPAPPPARWADAAADPEASPAAPRADLPPELPPEPPAPPVVDVTDLDWDEVRRLSSPEPTRARMVDTLDRMQRLLDDERGAGMLFDADRRDAHDRAILVRDLDPETPLWFVGDLHGDLLALEAALALVRREAQASHPPRLVFLGDLFDDGGYGLEVLLRVFELVVEAPGAVCIIAGNHDEALQHDGTRFTASVSPSDFAELLNAHHDDEAIQRAGLLAVRLFERAPRALFLPDGLLVAHGGIPLADLHEELLAHGDWNDPRCLQDFVWTRAHARARRKIPNRVSRGSQFGREDFAAFCAVAAQLGRPVRRMVRGHDHEEERFAMYPKWTAHPLLTTVALSRRLARESFGPDVRVPTIARWRPGTLPQVHRLHVPPAIVHELFPEASGAGQAESTDASTDASTDVGGEPGGDA